MPRFSLRMALRGNSAVKVQIDLPIFKTVSIAHDVFMADALLCVTHFKGHELSGIAGALKNLGMGCASREGKLSQHSNISPKVKEKACSSCKRCLQWCPRGSHFHDNARMWRVNERPL